LVGTTEENGQLGNPRPTWEGYIKIDNIGFMWLKIGTSSGLL
jgi:hypothetical protein